MRKTTIIAILAAVIAAIPAAGQNIPLATGGKCDGVTQAKLRQISLGKAPGTEVRLLAKVAITITQAIPKSA